MAVFMAFQIREILFEYVDLSMTKLCPEKGKIEELEDFYQVIFLIYFCLFIVFLCTSWV